MAFVEVQCYPTYENGKPNTQAETSARLLNADHIISARPFDESATHVHLVGNMHFIVAAALEEFHELLKAADSA